MEKKKVNSSTALNNLHVMGSKGQKFEKLFLGSRWLTEKITLKIKKSF